MCPGQFVLCRAGTEDYRSLVGDFTEPAETRPRFAPYSPVFALLRATSLTSPPPPTAEPVGCVSHFVSVAEPAGFSGVSMGEAARNSSASATVAAQRNPKW